MDTKQNENNIVITNGMSGNDVIVSALFATFMMIAGAVAYIVIRQVETDSAQNTPELYNATPYNVTPYNVTPHNTPLQITSGEDDFIPPVQVEVPTSTATHEFTITQETNKTELSNVTFLGYNTTGDLVGVMKRMPNGEVMRRKIRDPEMSLDNLEVDKWVEYNEWKKETEMDWI